MMEGSGGRDLSNGQEDVPVYIQTGADEDLPHFQYSPENVRGPGCEVDPSELTLPGCDCRAASCDPARCPCLRPGPAYGRDGRLREDAGAAEDARPAFECNALCACGESCGSRVVQSGLRVRLRVSRAGARGWGVRTAEALRRGAFVCEYAGEVIGFEEARRRQRRQGPRDRNYIVAVRERWGAGRSHLTFVDPALVGNVGRFLNHSCQPNLVMVPVRVHSSVPRLALFAARDVEPGEELTFDYSGGQGTPESEDTAGEGLERKVCLCGASNCTGFLPLDLSILPR